MKLTNISLAILVAIGLVACGGSDDNKNQPTDNNNAGHQGAGNGNPPPPPPPKGDSGLDPKRVAPGLTVPDDMKAIVAANKRLYVDRNFGDTALGYKGYDYNKKLGTDPADVKLTSTYNFYSENDIITKKPAGTAYSDDAIGAIYVGENPGANNNNAFVYDKTKDGYVRVAADATPATYKPNTLFYPIKKGAGIDKATYPKGFEQDKVVFIANANLSSEAGFYDGIPLKLGVNDTTKAAGQQSYNPTANQVLLKTITVFGQEYDAVSRGQNLDFSNMNVMKDIQTEEVTGTYQIINGKGTATVDDNLVLTESIKVGNIKAYNLPYSIAFVTTNLDEKKPAEKNIFNLDNGGAFQVLGFETVSLPQNGRTFYKGKSFSANATGDVTLYADLFEDRAGIGGVIDNRKDSKGKELATLTLEKTEFEKVGGIYATRAKGNVKGAPGYADVWQVQLFGPDAEEAAGAIYKDGATPVIKEVFNTQREGLTNQSNDSTVTP